MHLVKVDYLSKIEGKRNSIVKRVDDEKQVQIFFKLHLDFRWIWALKNFEVTAICIIGVVLLLNISPSNILWDKYYKC